MSERDDGGIEWLAELLQDVQLEQFFSRLRDDLQVPYNSCHCILITLTY